MIKLLSASIDASGKTGGGYIQLGGEYQGGINLEEDIIPNADILFINSGSNIKADATGTDGDGGIVILWSEDQTVVSGDISAMPGSFSGEGGFVEISSKDFLNFTGEVNTSFDDRAGTVLLDPKNITVNYPEYSWIIIGNRYPEEIMNISQEIQAGSISYSSHDTFGRTVSLDGNMLVIGNPQNSQFNEDQEALNDGTAAYYGAVYMYTFTDSEFSGGKLEGIIGKGYTGGKNIDVSNLDDYDKFGSNLSLDNNRLAVVASGDKGLNNQEAYQKGAVYLFTFTDNTFSNGTLQGIIGSGYTGGKNTDTTTIPGFYDCLEGISLDGNNLAIAYRASPYGDTVSILSFSDSLFSNGQVVSTIGNGYTGVKDIDVYVHHLDQFGGITYNRDGSTGISLDGTRIAIGCPGDDGYDYDHSQWQGTGAVFLFSYDDTSFNGGQLEAVIGKDYAGTKDYNFSTLTPNDEFGASVALENNQLVVGYAINYSNKIDLFTFDNDFSNITLQGQIGSGEVTGEKSILFNSGHMWTSPSLSLDNNRLAFGSSQSKVILFGFEDSTFSNGKIYGEISSDAGVYNNNIPNNVGTILSPSENFGSGVSLDGTGLAIGANQNDGFNASDTNLNYGAVYLYTFDDLQLNGGKLEGIIGKNYTGGKNINMNLDENDYFGSSVSLQNAQLVVGAPGDDGLNNLETDAGAVYLFNFINNDFELGTNTAKIGENYSVGRDINLDLDEGDAFGTSVSLDGNMLAVGAIGDDGLYGDNNVETLEIYHPVTLERINDKTNTGSVYLFNFSDSVFNNGTYTGIIGSDYTGDKNIDTGLENWGGGNSGYQVAMKFGQGISLNQNRLAVGRPGAWSDEGKVYLYSFTDNQFSGGQYERAIADGSILEGNIEVHLYGKDYFGQSVALEGNDLIVAATGDDGYGLDGNPPYNTADDNMFGALYMFKFDDPNFNTGRLEGIMGVDYNQVVGTHMEHMDRHEYFGSSLSLDNGRIAVGAPGDDGMLNSCSDSGAVYILQEKVFGINDVNSYNAHPDENVVFDYRIFNDMLDSGQNVHLKANNDITLQIFVDTDNPAGNGGSLTLEAGRSIFINNSINTDNSNLTLIANDILSNGVVNAQRDPGEAVITITNEAIDDEDAAVNCSIDTGSADILIDLRNGAGKTNNSGGDIGIYELNANNVTITNALGSVVDNKSHNNLIIDEESNINANNINITSIGIGKEDDDLNIDVDYNNSDGKLTAVSYYGDINISEYSGNLPVNYIASYRDVRLTSLAGIIDSRVEEYPNIYAKNINLTSTGIGTMAEDLDIYLNYGSTGGDLTAKSDYGEINISQDIGDLPVNEITSFKDVKLTSAGSILDLKAEETPNIYGNNIILNSSSAGIGSTLDDLDIYLNYMSTSGKLSIDSLNGLVNVSDNWNDNFHVNYIYSKKDVYLTTKGNILDARAGEDPNILGRSINLLSQNGSVGSASDDLDIYVNYLTSGGKLLIASVNGLVNIGQQYLNLPLYYIYSSKDVTVTTGAGIIDARTEEYPNIYGNNITLNSSSIGIGNSSEDLDIYLNHQSTGGKLSINSLNGPVYLNEEASTNVPVNFIYSKNDVSLSTNGNILDYRMDENPNIYGKNITLMSKGGCIGTTTEDLDIYVNHQSSGGKLSINSLYGLINIEQSIASELPVNYLYTKANVTISSAGNIIDARTDENPNIYGNNITLISSNGSVGSTTEELDLYINHQSSGGKLSVNALNGPVNIGHSLSTDLPLSYIYSKNNVTLSANGNIIDARTDENPNIYGKNIILNSTNGTIGTAAEDLNTYVNYGTSGGSLMGIAYNGLINLEQCVGDLPLNYVVSKQDVSLKSAGNILDLRDNETGNVYGKNITLNSTNGTIGTAAEDLNIYVNYGTSGGSLTGIAYNGLVNIEQYEGDLPLNFIVSKQDVSLKSAGNILDLRDNETGNVYGKNITLNSTNGTIGTAAEDLNIYVNYGTSGGSLTGIAYNGLVNIEQYEGDLPLNYVVSKQDVTLKAAGNIVDWRSGETGNIYGKNITISSSTGELGNSLDDLDIYVNYLSAGGKLTAIAYNGLINIDQYEGHLPLNYVVSKQDVTIKAAGNIVDWRSGETGNIYGKNITISSSAGELGNSLDDLDIYVNYLSSGGKLTATAYNGLINIDQYENSLTLNTIVSGSNVSLKSAGGIYTDTKLPTINIKGVDIDLTATTAIGTVANPIEVDASGNVTTNSPDTHVHEN